MAGSASSSGDSSGSSFNITLDDTSPVFVYSLPVTNLSTSSNGWAACYSAFGAPICDGNGSIDGISLHATSADGASLTLDWIGE